MKVKSSSCAGYMSTYINKYNQTSNFNYLFYGLCDSGVILRKIGTKLKLFYKERGTAEGVNPLIYVTKTYKYKSSLRKLILKLRISFTNKNVCKKLNVRVAFLSNQKPGGGGLGLLHRSFFPEIILSKL